MPRESRARPHSAMEADGDRFDDERPVPQNVEAGMKTRDAWRRVLQQLFSLRALQRQWAAIGHYLQMRNTSSMRLKELTNG